ncbi:MAG: four helix bundle protein [Candidatus Moranbacteria bacterium]|nr:four helix bundle protein [Candidatus Moranbacteria bacterium]
MAKYSKNYDLESRTLEFSAEIIAFIKKLNKDIVNIPIINQIIRSATSIGANYREANGASSKKDFHNKIYICKKECKETKYWIELLAKANPEEAEKCRELWKESQELTLIFSKIALTLKNKKEIKI